MEFDPLRGPPVDVARGRDGRHGARGSRQYRDAGAPESTEKGAPSPKFNHFVLFAPHVHGLN